MPNFRLALIQMSVTTNKTRNLENAANLVKKASQNGANVVVLPECFNSPYGTQYFAQYAEPLNGETGRKLSAMAQQNSIYLIGGSFPEKDGYKLFNTSTVWDMNGSMIAMHRKIHLFDIDIPGKITFKESLVLSPGDKQTIFETKYGKMGLGICYDMRFPELCMAAARNGALIMLYPGAFNTTTGPMHWELLQRARAVDNQIFVAACSPARDLHASYHAWGHSTVVDPIGRVIATTEENEDIVYADINIFMVDEARQNIPISSQRRFDIYNNVC